MYKPSTNRLSASAHPVQKMIDQIEYSLTQLEPFSLVKLGQQIGYSPFYCSFLFHHHTGISIKKYTLLRKMLLAAACLSETDERIIDIAIQYGYSSQAAFARAFKELFGITPAAYRQHPQPLQMYAKRNVKGSEVKMQIDTTISETIWRLQNQVEQLHEHDLLNVLNGQLMYERFQSHQWMGASNYVPFNEAMCVHEVTDHPFDASFCAVRAAGHGSTLAQYEQIVLKPLHKLFTHLHEYTCVVLWFGDDLFCQLNLLTMLAYLEQQHYRGTVYFNIVQEQTYEVQQTEMQLGSFASLYEQVLLHHQMPQQQLLPVMYQSIRLYIQLQQSDNELHRYIVAHADTDEHELVCNMLTLFTHYGLGDTQYIEMIRYVRGEVRE
ncbi:helix-turn-helix transcriptional regulator [Paenibacillus campi]|uniref:helix-turn-helix transcriptional regulator n=1 Tax=Paenibacillus campi TaxID=3106031 RepID=UPI002AFFF349|nr:helix-turn-helix transcriptional regulator [Paenibacillus sp. SGZ-1009]